MDMSSLHRKISMCARHHARWKRAAGFARTDQEASMCLERAQLWLDRQQALVSLLAAE